MRFGSIRWKILAGGFLLLSISIGLIFYLFYRDMTARERQELEEALNTYSTIVLTSLEYSMIQRDISGSQQVCERVGNISGVNRVWILNKGGVVKIASRRNEIGRKISKDNPVCQACHAKTPKIRPQTLMAEDEETAEKIYRNILQIKNKDECYGCHNPSEPLLGMILIDYSASDMVSWLFEETPKRFGYIFLFLFITVGFASYMLIDAVIIRRLDILEKGVSNFSEGRLESPIQIKGRDEIKELADAFNSMAEKIKAHSENLEGMVKDKTKDLEERLEELERFHRATIGREIVMHEVLEENERLRKRIEEMGGK